MSRAIFRLWQEFEVSGGAWYKTVEAQPMDMFPLTTHVECVIMMTNSGSEDKKDS